MHFDATTAAALLSFFFFFQAIPSSLSQNEKTLTLL